MYNSDHTATECIGQNKKKFLLPPESVDVLSRFIYTALWLWDKPMKTGCFLQTNLLESETFNIGQIQ